MSEPEHHDGGRTLEQDAGFSTPLAPAKMALPEKTGLPVTPGKLAFPVVVNAFSVVLPPTLSVPTRLKPLAIDCISAFGGLVKTGVG